MKIHLGKTKIVVFRTGGVLKHNESWTYQGQPIEVVSFYYSEACLVKNNRNVITSST